MTHKNEAVARSEMDAALQGDLEGMLAHYTDDVILHYPGRNRLSGTYRGIATVRNWIERIAQLVGPQGEFERSLHDVLASDDHAVQLVSVRARTSNGRSATWNAAIVMHLRGDKISEIWIHIDDPYAVDALLA